MMKKISMLLPLLALVACENSLQVEKAASTTGLSASMLCSGHTVAGITGTANCSGGGTPSGSLSIDAGLYVFSSRNDLISIDMTDPAILLDIVNGDIDRSAGVATLSQVYSSTSFLSFFKARYSAIPNPVTDSDGRYGGNPEGIEKKHYLETIVGRPTNPCGTNLVDSVSSRIADCAKPLAEGGNGERAFYNGRQYGQEGEGDWKLVTRLSTGEEVWRDERTKLLWSDKTTSNYNWFPASGYAKNTTVSSNETGYDAQPGSGSAKCYDSSWNPVDCQPNPPVSICAEVDDDGVVIAGGADPSYDGTYIPTSDASIEKAFKGNLNASSGVLWKLPSISDYKLADVNGIRKVLPNMDNYFWSSSSKSFNRYSAWQFGGDSGYLDSYDRSNGSSVRCVAFLRD